MNRIGRIWNNNKEILVINYSDCPEDEMISRVATLGSIIIQENKPVLLLSIFNSKSYVTAKFMKHAEEATQRVLHLLAKQAMVGLNDVKKGILKSYNLTFDKSVPSFDTKDEAIAFLSDDNTSDVGYWLNKLKP